MTTGNAPIVAVWPSDGHAMVGWGAIGTEHAVTTAMRLSPHAARQLAGSLVDAARQLEPDPDSMMTASTVADRVHQFREYACMTQTDLAKQMKAIGFRWHQQTVERTESGVRPVRLDEAVALAAILGVSVSVIAGVA